MANKPMVLQMMIFCIWNYMMIFIIWNYGQIQEFEGIHRDTPRDIPRDRDNKNPLISEFGILIPKSKLVAVTGENKDDPCKDILLYLPEQYASHGHGSQLNTYILAVMVATYMNKAMVILEAPEKWNKYEGGSQFGCPAESLDINDTDFPNGLSRLIYHPEWLSHSCPLPCQGTYSYGEWRDKAFGDYNTDQSLQHQQIQCIDEDANIVEVLPIGGRNLRRLKNKFRHQMVNHGDDDAMIVARKWVLRLGATQHEAEIFSGLTGQQDIWDYISALLARSGILQFQPWIARDVKEFIETSDLPWGVPYSAIHVRRGDKLKKESAGFVRRYWNLQGVANPSVNYIPFSHYLHQWDGNKCNEEEEGATERVYIATDDPVTVYNEIDELSKGHDADVIFECHKFRFVFSPIIEKGAVEHHIQHRNGNCLDTYRSNIAAIADLMLLARSDNFVGEYNSNWGRLVRVFRMFINEDGMVSKSYTRVAWGNMDPGMIGL